MSRGDEELGAVIFSELTYIKQPVYVSEICDRVEGLKKRQAKVALLLQRMCDNSIVVKVGEKYILSENWTKTQRQDSDQLSCDSPAYGVACTNNPRNDFNFESRSSPVQGATGGTAVVVPQTRRAVVPVQQQVVRRSSSSDSTCDVTELQKCQDNLEKIISFLQQSERPVKAKDIAQGTGIGRARSDVNRYLYFLKERNVLELAGTAEWKFVKSIKEDDLVGYAAEMAKKPPSKSKGKQSSGTSPSNSSCVCPNAGPNCYHIQQNFQQNHYYMQVGEHNRMVSGSPTDGSIPKGDH